MCRRQGVQASTAESFSIGRCQRRRIVTLSEVVKPVSIESYPHRFRQYPIATHARTH